MSPASDSNSEGVADGVGGGVEERHNDEYTNKGSPPPYDHALYANYQFNKNGPAGPGGVAGPATPSSSGDLVVQSLRMMQQEQEQQHDFTTPTPVSTTNGSYGGVSPVSGGGSSSFTNTFLRGILTSIDSKDPVVANAWLETLLDAIDLLPPDVIKREIIAIGMCINGV
jgi:hypothetical protein